MAIDADPLSVALQLSKQELDTGVEQALSDATVAGVLSLLPGVGSAIQSLIDGKAQRNVERRWVQLFADLKEHIDAIRDTIPDDAYYGSEEFQTLLALAYEQLLTTHDQAKLKMLATGLANSGSRTFHADDKEPYIRTLRDLSLSDLQRLRSIAKFNNSFPIQVQKTGLLKSDNASMARLSGLGLIDESVKFKDFDMRIADVPSSRQSPDAMARTIVNGMRQYFEQAPSAVYKLSGFGARFLKFIASASPEAKAQS